MFIEQDTSQKDSNEFYKKKYKKMRTNIKDMIFENAALGDEVNRYQDKVLRAREERKFLMNKLFYLQAMTEKTQSYSEQQANRNLPIHPPVAPPQVIEMRTLNVGIPQLAEKPKKKRKSKNPSIEGKPKKAKTQVSVNKSAINRLVQPITLDSTGRPVFPLVLGQLTIHSLGEVLGKPGYHSQEYIYPVGFCSSRLYASAQNVNEKCLYTCQILEGQNGPQFEISSEDINSAIFQGGSANECYENFIKGLHLAGRAELSPQFGPDFFGFSNPTVQNLIQNSSGARKCNLYKWVKFIVCKSEEELNSIAEEKEPALNFDVLQKFLN